MGTAVLPRPAPPFAAHPKTPCSFLHSSLALPSSPVLVSLRQPNSTHRRRPSPLRFSLRPDHKRLLSPSHPSSRAPSLPPKALPKPLSTVIPPLPPFHLSRITPLTVCKWCAFLCLALAAAKKTLSLLLNPFFWTYFSWTWLFWPWIVAILLAAYGLYCFYRHSVLRSSSVLDQLAIVTATITWLTVVPPAHFNGFLEGWPVALFFVYHYFFFFESSVRKRLYGDLYPRDHDPKWEVVLPKPFQIVFAVLVLIGHWLAAYEGPELHLISGGWANVGTWLLVALTLFMRYHSVLYLAKYSEKVAVPTAVVQFGPYRWVRHPIYASTMLLFALHCIALRAPISLLFLIAVGVVYYGQKAELEEALMLETFGERYTEYMNKVRYRLIPFVY